jgi:hypothetical protein
MKQPLCHQSLDFIFNTIPVVILGAKFKHTYTDSSVGYEEESVNRSQMDTKRQIFIIRNWKKKNIYFSTNPPSILIHLSHRFTSGSKPAAWKSFDCFFQPLPQIRFNLFIISEKGLPPTCERSMRQTLPQTNRKHFFMNIFCFESSYPQRNSQ